MYVALRFGINVVEFGVILRRLSYRSLGSFLSWAISSFQIVEVEMPFDKTKNQRKGFCFITFESEQVVQELLKSPKQSINGKEVIISFSEVY
jgi:RNA recognition motif-containing protein